MLYIRITIETEVTEVLGDLNPHKADENHRDRQKKEKNNYEISNKNTELKSTKTYDSQSRTKNDLAHQNPWTCAPNSYSTPCQKIYKSFR